jgi:copper chaperone CopZ
MNPVTYPLQGLHCGACVARVTQALKPLADDVQVSLQPMQVTLKHPHADVAALKTAVASAGAYVLVENRPLAGIESARVATNLVANELQPSWFSTYRPLLLIAAYLLLGSVLVQFGLHAGHGMGWLDIMATISAQEVMRYFMAGFFLVFSFFKLLDLRAFANAYAGYDLLAARWRAWGFIYPFVELLLGVAYLSAFNLRLTHWVTIIVMGFSAIGVIRAVLNKNRIQCACLGTVFKLPMSSVTIIEDLGMVAMAAAMLLQM